MAHKSGYGKKSPTSAKIKKPPSKTKMSSSAAGMSKMMNRGAKKMMAQGKAMTKARGTKGTGM